MAGKELPALDACLCVSEVIFSAACLEGLDEPVEICCITEADIVNAEPWGWYWRSHLEPVVPACVQRDTIPPEGGLLFRPLRAFSSLAWEVDPATRRVAVPPRSAHARLGLAEPRAVGNEVFIELRYSMPPSLVGSFDYDDLRDGIFRAFALPVFEGGGTARMLLVLDEAAVTHRLSLHPPERPDLAARDRSRLPGYQASARLEGFLNAAAGSPLSSQWSSTVGRSELDDPPAAPPAAAVPAPAPAPMSPPAPACDPGAPAPPRGSKRPFPHQRRTAAWMRRVEAPDVAGLRIEPLAFAGREFGYEYEVRLPCGGCIAHPPGAGKTMAVAWLVAQQPRPSLVVCPSHLQPHWRETLAGVGCTVLAPTLGEASTDANPAADPPAADPPSSFAAAAAALYQSGLAPAGGDAGGGTAGGGAGGGTVLLVGMDQLESLSRAVSAAAEERTAGGEGRGLGCWASWRLVIDEPQDVPAASLPDLHHLASHFGVRWLVCGTAASHLPLLGALLLGPRRWRQAMTSHEWAKRPSVAHILRRRFLLDPPWHCLPVPLLDIVDVPVVPSQDEALSAQLAALSGYLIDSLLFLSFGPQAAARAATERRRAAAAQLQYAYRGLRDSSVGDAWAAAVEAADGGGGGDDTGGQNATGDAGGGGQVCAAALAEGLSDEESGEEEAVGGEAGFVSMGLFLVNSWHSVEARCRERLAKTERRLARVRARLCEQQQRYQLFSPSSAPSSGGVLERLAFLGGSALISLELRTDQDAGPDLDSAWFPPWPNDELAAAEWNSLLVEGEDAVWAGPLVLGVDDGERVTASADGAALGLPRGAVVLCAAPADCDWCSLAWRASAAGAAALLVASPTSIATPMAYASTARAPPVPAAMLPAAAAARGAALLREHGTGGGDNGGDAGAADACGGGGIQARVRVLRADLSEDHQGLMAEVVALEDALDPATVQRAEDLEAEAAQLRRGLRFAAQVRDNLLGGGAGRPPAGDVSGSLAMPREGAAAVQSARAEAAACPVCLETRPTVCVMPQCFHLLCQPCLQAAVGGASSFNCPLCRVQVDAWSVCLFRVVGRHAEGTEDADEPAPAPNAVPALTHTPAACTAAALAAAASPRMPSGLSLPRVTWGGLPRKLQALLSLVAHLLAEAPDERVLVYTQWLAHVRHLRQLLHAAAVPALAMAGSLEQCMRALADFGRPGQPRVLLLSSQHHASGINLQAARNVILLHPFCTPTATTPDAVLYSDLLSYERQAIGRVRRWPQARTVRVYRLFAQNSVEHGLYSQRWRFRGADDQV